MTFHGVGMDFFFFLELHNDTSKMAMGRMKTKHGRANKKKGT